MAALIVECLVNPGSAQQFSWMNGGEDTGNNEKNEPDTPSKRKSLIGKQ